MRGALSIVGMLWLAVLCGHGCLLSPQPDPPGIDDATDGGTGRDEGDTVADGPADASADADADGAGEVVGDIGEDTYWNYDENCPTDPSDGPTGESCGDDGDCEPGFACVPEYSADDAEGTAWVDVPGGYCLPTPDPAGGECEPGRDETCPVGARCVRSASFGSPGTARCLDACSISSLDGALYGANCDCRPGYRCDRSTEVCVPGCVADHECCATWQDANGNGVRELGELTALDGCTSTCDPHTFECVDVGDPEALVGDACLHGSQCPPETRCWRTARAAREGRPGVCLLERCDLPDRACPPDAVCVAKDPGTGFDSFCARPCSTTAAPGSIFDVCDPATACVPAETPAEAPLDGVCLPRI
jgi:hypothetical protein